MYSYEGRKDWKREMNSTGSSEVKTYFLSEEEREKYMPKLTEEQYITYKKDGLSNKQIADKLGITEPAIYYYINKWKDTPQEPQKEQPQNDIYLASQKQVEELKQLIQEVTKSRDEYKAKYQEIDKKYSELCLKVSNLVTDRERLEKENQRLQEEISRLVTQNNAYLERMDEVEHTEELNRHFRSVLKFML